MGDYPIGSYDHGYDDAADWEAAEREKEVMQDRLAANYGDRIGIPYARVIDISDYGVRPCTITRQCPECAVTIVEETDHVGEMLTNRYAEHYAAAHPDGR